MFVLIDLPSVNGFASVALPDHSYIHWHIELDFLVLSARNLPGVMSLRSQRNQLSGGGASWLLFPWSIQVWIFLSIFNSECFYMKAVSGKQMNSRLTQCRDFYTLLNENGLENPRNTVFLVKFRLGFVGDSLTALFLHPARFESENIPINYLVFLHRLSSILTDSFKSPLHNEPYGVGCLHWI